MRLLTHSTQDHSCKSVGFCRVSQAGQLLEASPQFCRLLGYSQSELLQLPYLELFFPSAADILLSVDSNSPHLQDIFLIAKGGKVIQTCATCLLERATPNAEPHHLFLIEDVAARCLERNRDKDYSQINLSQAIYAVHSGSSIEEILQATEDWCRALLSSFIGIRTDGFRQGGQWRVFSGSKRAIVEHIAELDSVHVATYLHQGKCVKLQTSPLSAPLMSECLYWGAEAARGKEDVVLLPSQTCPGDRVCLSPDILFIPIHAQGVLWGAIALSLSAADQFFPFNAAPMPEVERAIDLAGHAALAITKIAGCENMQQRNRELTQWVRAQTQHLQQALNFEAAIKRITEKIRDSLDEHYIFETVIRELCETLVLDRCTVSFYNLEQQTVEIRYEHVTTDDCYDLEGHISPMAANAAVYAVLREGNCIQFSPRTACGDRLSAAQNTTLAYPLTDGQQVIGDLWLSRPKYSAFNEQEQRLIQQVTSQCAIGLRQARLYQTSQAQVESLEILGTLKDDFLSTVSHELRTPITNIKMTVKMLELSLGLHPVNQARIDQYLRILRTETQRELTLINDLLDLQRLDSGGQVLESSPIELAPWVSQIVDSFRERAKDNQQQLHLTVVTETPFVVSDEDCLKRIIAELLNNACKYTPPQESISVDVHLCSKGLQLSVSNSGVVIPTIEHKHVFEKFYRIRSSDSRKKGGTGLGLALIKQLAQHLSGDISLVSSDNLTSFTLKLPVLPQPAASATDSE